MALIATRVYEVRIVTTGDVPAPSEFYVDGGDIECALEIVADVGVVNQHGGEIRASVEARTEIRADIDAINPAGGEIEASIEAAVEIQADVEVVEP